MQHFFHCHSSWVTPTIWNQCEDKYANSQLLPLLPTSRANSCSHPPCVQDSKGVLWPSRSSVLLTPAAPFPLPLPGMLSLQTASPLTLSFRSLVKSSERSFLASIAKYWLILLLILLDFTVSALLLELDYILPLYVFIAVFSLPESKLQ